MYVVEPKWYFACHSLVQERQKFCISCRGACGHVSMHACACVCVKIVFMIVHMLPVIICQYEIYTGEL